MILGYLAVWVIFGWFAYLGDSLLHEVVERSLFLSRNEGYFAAVLLLVAATRICLHAACVPAFTAERGRVRVRTQVSLGNELRTVLWRRGRRLV
jgi:predicted metal-binding membrane protein